MHLSKKTDFFIFLIIFVFFLLSNTLFPLAQIWNSCPFDLQDDPYPGECGRYIDTNEDGICDLSQPNPTDYANPADINAAIVTQGQTDSTTNTFVSPEEHEYSVEISGSRLKGMTIHEIAQLWDIDAENLLLKLKEDLLLEENYSTTNTIDELRSEMHFSPSLVKIVAEGLKKQDQSPFQAEESSLNKNEIDKTRTSEETHEKTVTQQIIFPDYNLIEIGLITLLFYLGGKWLAAKLEISPAKEKKFWNVLLLISFIGSAATGFILIFIRDFGWFGWVNFNFLFWHVEYSIAMGLIGLFHALWHIKYYGKIFYKQK